MKISRYLKYKNQLIVLLLLLNYNAMAQVGVGINMVDPTHGVFQIDANANTIASNDVSDDIIVDNQGRLGIGVVPTHKLHIQTEGTAAAPVEGFQYQYGNGVHTVGAYLISNANGVARWQSSISSLRIIKGDYAAIGFTCTLSSSMRYIGTHISLDPGIWIVQMSNLIGLRERGSALVDANLDKKLFIRMSLSDSSVYPSPSQGDILSVRSSDLMFNRTLMSNITYTSSQFCMISGFLLVHNQTPSTKTYYLTIGGIVTFLRTQDDPSGAGLQSVNHLELFGLGTANSENILTALYLGEDIL
ncbi:hypothetical protein [Dysgonomonas sp. GY617]|uniref:hypothetical protein n=1 Tax=Dysgonomonas sp. GY617 TaxID=2780420 RepID=UPI001884774E|nr:hypothetical protein [Dysgonomonas sp. GY617]MBF0575549.1 hypothetical protein [Dysgonomonas sp. GY617]